MLLLVDATEDVFGAVGVLDLEVEGARAALRAVEAHDGDVREKDVHGRLVDEYEAALERIQKAAVRLARTRIAFATRRTFCNNSNSNKL